MAGSRSLEDVIGIVPLTAALKATTSGIPNPFPAEFAVVKAENRILGDRARWIRINGARTTAKIADYGAPGRRVPLQPISWQNIRCLYLGLEFNIDANMLVRLQAFLSGGPYHQDSGVDWIKYNLAELGKRMANTRIVCMASMLRFGAIYWDGDGNVLPSSSGAIQTLSAQVPANNQNQLNGIGSAPWNLPNTDIFAQLRALEKQAAKDTGLVPAHILYGSNIISDFQNNSLLEGYFARHANFRDTLVDTAKVPKNFADIPDWTPVYTAFFEDQNGNNQSLWDDDLIVVTPDLKSLDHMDWFGMYEGSCACLTDLNAYADAMGALGAMEQKYGQSGWSLPRFTQPLGIDVILQDSFLPAIKNEKAIYQWETSF